MIGTKLQKASISDEVEPMRKRGFLLIGGAMRRNWKTLRDVLEAVEEERIDDAIAAVEEKDRLAKSVGERTHHEDEFFGHMLLAVDAGLVEGFEVVTTPPSEWQYRGDFVRLTMSGHDLLDALRSDKVFKKALALASSAAVPLTVDLIKEALRQVVGMVRL